MSKKRQSVSTQPHVWPSTELRESFSVSLGYSFSFIIHKVCTPFIRMILLMSSGPIYFSCTHRCDYTWASSKSGEADWHTASSYFPSKSFEVLILKRRKWPVCFFFFPIGMFGMCTGMLHPWVMKNNHSPCFTCGLCACTVPLRSVWLSCFKPRDRIVLFLWTLNESDVIVLWDPLRCRALRWRLTSATRFHTLPAFNTGLLAKLIKLVVIHFGLLLKLQHQRNYFLVQHSRKDESSVVICLC